MLRFLRSQRIALIYVLAIGTGAPANEDFFGRIGDRLREPTQTVEPFSFH